MIQGKKVVGHKLDVSKFSRERADGTTSLFYRQGTYIVDTASNYLRRFKRLMQETIKRPVYTNRKLEFFDDRENNDKWLYGSEERSSRDIIRTTDIEAKSSEGRKRI